MRHLAALVAVARMRSFRGAAAELGYVQSAVSHQLAELERIVGIPLVERRSGRGVASLTYAGELLARRAELVMDRLRAARIDVQAAESGAIGTIRVATLPDLTSRVLERVLPEIAERLPTAALDVIEVKDGRTPCELVEGGAAEIALDIRPDRPPLTGVILFHDRFDLIAGPESLIGRQGRPPSLDELAECQLLVPAGIVPVAQVVVAGIPAEQVIPISAAGAVRARVAIGDEIGLVPRSQLDPLDQAVVRLSAPDLVPPRCIALCWHPARVPISLNAALRDIVNLVHLVDDSGSRSHAA